MQFEFWKWSVFDCSSSSIIYLNASFIWGVCHTFSRDVLCHISIMLGNAKWTLSCCPCEYLYSESDSPILIIERYEYEVICIFYIIIRSVVSIWISMIFCFVFQ